MNQRSDRQQLGLSIEELAEQTGSSIRTIRYYIAEGLLPSPGTRGKAALYGEEQQLRLRLIRLLIEQRIPLAEIRQRLAPLSIEEVRSLLRDEQDRSGGLRRLEEEPSPQAYIAALLRRARSPEPAESVAPSSRLSMPAIPPYPDPPRSRGGSGELETWRRLELAPGLELQVRADVEARYRELIERFKREATRAIDRQP